MWLFDAIDAFFHSIAEGDRSWWPFLISLVVLTGVTVGRVVWKY